MYRLANNCNLPQRNNQQSAYTYSIDYMSNPSTDVEQQFHQVCSMNKSPLIWDAHSCIPLHPDATTDHLHRHLKAGVSYVSINVGMDFNPLSQILTTMASFRQQISADPHLVMANRSADILDAQQTGRLAVGFDLEGAIPLCERPEMVQLYWDLGVRQMHLAYNQSNSISGGCHDEDSGLSVVGKAVVNAIFKCGMLMDLSHMGYQSALEVCEMADGPVVYSHANPRALVDHPRNIPDHLIVACAQTGGVICINGVERFLGVGQLTAKRFAEHAAHVAELVGPEHVGMGIDTFTTQDGIRDMPDGLVESDWWPKNHYQTGIGTLNYLQPEDIPCIQSALFDHGFSSKEIDGILGLNMMRVAQQTWPT